MQQCVATRVPREIVEYISKNAAACENFKCPSTNRVKFCLTVDSAGVISERYELPLSFNFASIGPGSSACEKLF